MSRHFAQIAQDIPSLQSVVLYAFICALYVLYNNNEFINLMEESNPLIIIASSEGTLKRVFAQRDKALKT